MLYMLKRGWLRYNLSILPRGEKKSLAMLSISWDASLEDKKALNENESSLSSGSAAEVSETEAETTPRADGNRDKVLVLPEGVSNSSLRSGLNVSEYKRLRF